MPAARGREKGVDHVLQMGEVDAVILEQSPSYARYACLSGAGTALLRCEHALGSMSSSVILSK